MTAYCLVETGLLLTAEWPSFTWRLTPYKIVVIWGQWLFIPGLSVLFFRLMDGPLYWGRKTLAALAAVRRSVLMVVLMLSAFVGLSSIAEENTAFVITLLVLDLAGIVAGVVAINRKGRRQSLELEAERWLAERQSAATPADRRWRNRGIRWALWIPSLIVLMVLLFYPEIFGIFSRVRHPAASQLAGYRVHPPLTWIVVDTDFYYEPGKSVVWGLAGRGMAFGIAPYLHRDPPLSHWVLSAESHEPAQAIYRSKPKTDDVVGHRVFTIGGESLTCLEYWPPHLVRPARIEDLPLAFIECEGSGQFVATFSGERRHAPAFYKMIEGVTRAK